MSFFSFSSDEIISRQQAFDQHLKEITGERFLEYGFAFVNGTGARYDNLTARVWQVRFPVTRWSNRQATISFNVGHTVSEAIEAAEEFLGKPLTEQWKQKFDEVSRGRADDEPPVFVRGDLLGRRVMLETLDFLDINFFQKRDLTELPWEVPVAPLELVLHVNEL